MKLSKIDLFEGNYLAFVLRVKNYGVGYCLLGSYKSLSEANAATDKWLIVNKETTEKKLSDYNDYSNSSKRRTIN